MIDQSLVQTGFDMELLIGEKYFQYMLLSLCETGSIPNWVESVDPTTNEDMYIIIHRPPELETQRLYNVYPGYLPYPGGGIFVLENAVADAFAVTIIPAFVDVAIVNVKIWISKSPKSNPENISIPIPITLNLRIRLIKDTDEKGFDTNVKLNFELYGAETNFEFLGITEQELLEILKPNVNRNADLSIGGTHGGIQNIKMRTSAPGGEGPPVIGFYINLKLKDGPEKDNYLSARGDYFLAKNFLPEGQYLAFAFSNELYRLLGRDLKFRMATLRENTNDQYYYPVMVNGHQKGSIKSVSVKPRNIAPLSEPVYSNELLVTVHGDYEWHSFYPDFYFTIRFTPQFNNGFLSWKTSYSLSVPSLDIAAAIIEVIFASLVVTLPLAFAVYFIKEGIIDNATDSIVASQDSRDTNFMEMLPDKLPIETRRWDPMYNTIHQVVSSINELTINDKGFAISSGNVFVGKEFSPVNHVVIRDKERDSSNKVSSLLYRVKDYNSFRNFFSASFAGVDRMPFRYIPPAGNESHRVALLIHEENGIIGRIAKNNILQQIPYEAKKIDILENQVFRILSISSTEVAEITANVKQKLSNEQREINFELIWNKAIASLILEGNISPTIEEINKRFETELTAVVDAISPPYIEEEIPNHLLLELEPDEMGHLQLEKILRLINFDLIQMHNNTIYFRDHADGNLEDNLLSRPRYISDERTT